MKVAILSSASGGGAGIAAYRVYEALSELGQCEVDFYDVQRLSETMDKNISLQHNASNNFYTNTLFTIDYATYCRPWILNLLSQYDVINIHWSCYLLSLSEISVLSNMDIKIVFTLHDFYYITGGCHYPAGCTLYRESCGRCPQVDLNISTNKLVYESQQIKRAIFSKDNVSLVAPSEFLAMNAMCSGIVPSDRIYVIRNTYKPLFTYHEKWLGNRSILLIADTFYEKRKGLSLAVEAIKEACKKYSHYANGRNIELHLVGRMDSEIEDLLQGCNLNIVCHGHLSSHEDIVNVFNVCHFILSCSYEDNWPNIFVESAAYGCVPIVGRWHGCEEFVNFAGVGFVSENYSPNSFAEEICRSFLLSDTELSGMMEKVSDVSRAAHNASCIAGQYVDCFSGGDSVGSYDSNIHAGDGYSVNHLLFNDDIDDYRSFEVKESPFGVSYQKECSTIQDDNNLRVMLCKVANEDYGIPVLSKRCINEDIS